MLPTECLCTRLRRASRGVSKLYDDALSGGGLNVARYSPLRHLQRLDRPSITDLADAMGLLRLSTVPLSNGTVATLFGVRDLSMLGGIAFLFHQLGSFMGGWLGGHLYDHTGGYDLVWQISIVLGVLAAALNWPVREQPVTRLRGAQARR